MRRRARYKSVTYDMGDGFYVDVEQRGAGTIYYTAIQLDEPGGFVLNRRRVECGSRKAANEQVETWKREDTNG